MEEAGLRPDFIAGTSMGSIVGAFYALGYSAEEIDSIVRQVSWDQVLSNKVPLNYIAFEEKEYYDRYLVEFPIEDWRIKVGTGLIRGQMLSELMHYYFWPALAYKNFDEFPIPFRCVATDVRNGEALVFRDGSLPEALRASMAIPTAFTAVERDSNLLVDGGVVNNFPVELAQAWGADYIIGVNVGTKAVSEMPESMPDILMKLSMLPSTKRLSQQIKDCDVYIQPNLEGFDAASFSDALEILARGDSTGQEYLPALKQLAQKIGRTNVQPLPKIQETLIDIEAIEIEGNHLFSKNLILRKLNIALGQSASRQDLELGLRRVFGINGFKNIDYRIEANPEKPGAGILKIRVREKEADYLYGSLHADNLFSAGITLNYTSRDFIGKESRSIFALDISRNPRFRFDHYQYIKQDKRLAFNFRYDYGALQIPRYDEGELSDIGLSFTHRLEANVLTTQSLKESYGGGVFFQSSVSRLRFGVNALPGIRNSTQNLFGLRFSHTANDLNDRNFPTKGGESLFILNTYLDMGLRVRFDQGVDSVSLSNDNQGAKISEEDFNTLVDLLDPGIYFDLLWTQRKYLPLSAQWQLIPYSAAGLSIGRGLEGSIVNGFRLGGMQRVLINDVRVLGLQFGERETANFTLLGLQAQRILWEKLYLRGGINGLLNFSYLSLENWGQVLGGVRSFEADYLLGFGVEGVLRTFFGPIALGVSSNTLDWQPRYYVGLGFSFNYSD